MRAPFDNWHSAGSRPEPAVYFVPQEHRHKPRADRGSVSRSTFEHEVEEMLQVRKLGSLCLQHKLPNFLTYDDGRLGLMGSPSVNHASRFQANVVVFVAHSAPICGSFFGTFTTIG